MIGALGLTSLFCVLIAGRLLVQGIDHGWKELLITAVLIAVIAAGASLLRTVRQGQEEDGHSKTTGDR